MFQHWCGLKLKGVIWLNEWIYYFIALRSSQGCDAVWPGHSETNLLCRDLANDLSEVFLLAAYALWISDRIEGKVNCHAYAPCRKGKFSTCREALSWDQSLCSTDGGSKCMKHLLLNQSLQIVSNSLSTYFKKFMRKFKQNCDSLFLFWRLRIMAQPCGLLQMTVSKLQASSQEQFPVAVNHCMMCFWWPEVNLQCDMTTSTLQE